MEAKDSLFVPEIELPAHVSEESEELDSVFSSTVSIDCVMYAPNPGNIKGDIRLNNGTNKQILVTLLNGATGKSHDYQVSRRSYVPLKWIVWPEVHCGHQWTLVSWKPV